MSTITSLVGTDGITTANSMTKINTNFANLNTDKIETSTLDTDTSLTANSDSRIPTQKAVKAYVDSGGNSNASTTTRGIVQEATSAQVISRTGTGSTGARLFINPSSLSSVFKFGGDGSDGALSITSGTTSVDLAGARLVIKNYTSISITGTGALNFINPHNNGTLVVLKVVGDVTLTSSATPMIDLRSLGATGGAGVAVPGAGSTTSGNIGNSGMSIGLFTTNPGQGGTASPGNGGSAASFLYDSTIVSILKSKYPDAFVGSGGGSGAAVGGSGGLGSGNSGDGGRGSGSAIIECGGAWNFTTSSGISVAGSNGTSGNVSGGTNTVGCGGGGGSAGYFKGLYNSLVANSGTVTTSGGTGASKSGIGSAGGGGGGGGGAGAGNNGSGTTGGNGASGISSIEKNTEFV